VTREPAEAAAPGTADGRAAVLVGLELIRETVGDLHRIAGAVREATAGATVPMAAGLEHQLTRERRVELERQVAALEPWQDGPFPLGGDLVVTGTRRCDVEWERLVPHLGALSGRRVLALRCGAGFVPFGVALRGAGEVLACEPSESIRQARFLESIYASGVDFRQLDWPQLEPGSHGAFDLIHSPGMLHREPNPMLLLARLHALLADGGQLLLGAVLHGGAESSEHVRLVPGPYAGEEGWWFVPGRLAARWMLERAGFEVEELWLAEGPVGEFPTLEALFRATRKSRPAGTRHGGAGEE
jgi:SAM-dependent methyltransferase